MIEKERGGEEEREKGEEGERGISTEGSVGGAQRSSGKEVKNKSKKQNVKGVRT